MDHTASSNMLSHPAFVKRVDRERFIDAMGAAVTGVTAVATSGGAPLLFAGRSYCRPDWSDDDG